MSKKSLLWLVLLLAFPSVVRADALRKLDDAASGRKKDSSPSRDRDRDDDEDSDEDHDESWSYSSSSSSGGTYLDDEESGELLEALALVFTLPWALPHHLIDEPCLRGYARYPSADGRGNLRADGSACKRDVPQGDPVLGHEQGQRPRPVAAQLDMESGYMRQQVVPATLALRVQLPHRTELSARTSFLSDLAELETEHAMNSNLLVAWRFAQGKHTDLRSGFGVRHYRLDRDRWGVDTLYALDFFTRHGLVGRAELHLGSLEKAFAIEGRGTLGVMVSRFELYAGGDVMALFGPGSKGKVGGGVAGLRVWF